MKTIMHHHQETCIPVYSFLHFFHSLSLDLDHDPYKCFETFIGASLNYSSGTAVRSRFSNLPSPSSPSHQLQSCISAHFHTGIGAFSSCAVYGLVGMTFSLSSGSGREALLVCFCTPWERVRRQPWIRGRFMNLPASRNHTGREMEKNI